MIPLLYLAVGQPLPSIKKADEEDVIVFQTESHNWKDGKTLSVINVTPQVYKSPRRSSFFLEDGNVLILINGDWELQEQHLQLLKDANASHYKDWEALAFLYKTKGLDSLKGLLGEHNIVVGDFINHTVRGITSLLGMYPLYYWVDRQSNFVLSTSLSLMGAAHKTQLNKAALAQICLYNYSISDASLLQGIDIMPPASVFDFKGGNALAESYWSPRELLGGRLLGFQQGVELVDEYLDKAVKRICDKIGNCSISLTGGWDGRLVLAYMLQYMAREEILAYSFGTKDSPDVSIPAKLSSSFGLNYSPFILDEAYLSTAYLDSARATAIYSDGYRGVRKAHYHHAMQQLSRFSPAVVTGICGSNILKGVATSPSVVFNERVLDLMSSSDFEMTLEKHYQDLKKAPHTFATVRFTEFYESVMSGILPDILSISDYTERFSTFVMAFTERKYFGPELSSYRHLTVNFSPFIDHDFIKSVAKTIFYNGSKKSSSIFSNWQNSMLYARLTTAKSRELANFMSDKGVSLTELLNPIRYPAVMIKQYLRRRGSGKANPDPYNTRGVLRQFSDAMGNVCKDANELLSKDERFLEGLLTALYWYENFEDKWKEV